MTKKSCMCVSLNSRYYENDLINSLSWFFRPLSHAENYTFNPINSFHMLKRNVEWLPKLLPSDSIYNSLFSNPEKAFQEAAFGIVDIQGWGYRIRRFSIHSFYMVSLGAILNEF